MSPPLRSRTTRQPAWRRTAGLTAVALILSSPALTAAEGISAATAAPCAPREVLLRRLAEGYGEAPQALGLTGNGALLELLVSPGGRSFSILMTRPPSAGAPGRVSCLVAAGEGWRAAAPAEEPGRET